jgi:hypothetical protein
MIVVVSDRGQRPVPAGIARMFMQVELRGLEPLTLCLQKRLKSSGYVGPIQIGPVLAGQRGALSRFGALV